MLFRSSQFHFVGRVDVLRYAAPGATVLLNSPYPLAETWTRLPRDWQEAVIAKGIRLMVIDATKVATASGMGRRTNTVLQTCFFALSGVLPRDEAIAQIKAAITKTYGRKGDEIVRMNHAAVDAALAGLHEVPVPAAIDADARVTAPPTYVGETDFVRRVTTRLLAGDGDLLPVSAFPVDGVFPSGTTRFEKRAIAHEIPIWDPSICIDCGKCAIVCPHAAIRMKVYPEAALAGAPAGFKEKEFKSKELAGHRLTIQVAPDDCTGCEVCVEVCPARSKTEVRRKALRMEPAAAHQERERRNFGFFLGLPETEDRKSTRLNSSHMSESRMPSSA